MRDDTITVIGNVGIAPKWINTAEGARFISLRLGSTARKHTRAGEWEDRPTNWYTVIAFGDLAEHIAACVEVGQPLIVFGRLEVKSWDKGEKAGIDVQIVADAVGHDLARGTGRFTRSVSSRSVSDAAPVGEPEGESPRAEDSDQFASAGVTSTPIVPF